MGAFNAEALSHVQASQRGNDRDPRNACSRTYAFVAEPACRMERDNLNAASSHRTRAAAVASSALPAHSSPADMASRRGVSKRPAPSEGTLSSSPGPCARLAPGGVAD